MSNLLPNGKQQYDSAAGLPLVGGQVFTYAAGTSTPLQTTSDAAGLIPNTNPVILDARGEAVIFWSGAYKVTLKDSLGNLIWTVDNVLSTALGMLADGSALTLIAGLNIPTNPITTAETAAAVTPTSYLYPALNPYRYGANGAGGAADTAAFASVRSVLAKLSSTSGLVNGLALSAVPQSAAEAAASITPANFYYPNGLAPRYGADVTGTLDSTATLQTFLNATWAQFQFIDVQGLWNGGGGASPIATLPPGKYKLSGSLTLPGSATFTGIARPANTVSHTRLIMNSTGITPARVWVANAVIKAGSNIQAVSGGTTYRYTTTLGGVSSATLPAWAAGGSTTDGTVTWVNQGAVTAGDNRNTPMLKFSRSTLPTAGVLQDQYYVASLQNLELWCVVPGGSFGSPLSGAGMQVGDYPLGGALYFDLDVVDTRIVDCVFQNTPCALRIHNAKSATTAGDGFANTFGALFYVERCEFDTAGAHIWADNSNLDLTFRNCDFYGSVHLYQNCTGSVVYDNCRFYGGAYIEASNQSNAFTRFRVANCEFEQQNAYDNISVYGAAILDIKSNTFSGASGTSCIVANMCSGGQIAANAFINSGSNAPATTGSLAAAAVKLIDCFNMGVQGNVIGLNDGQTYNGFGILTLSVGRGSQANFISGNSVTAPYNAALYNGQDRYINIVSAADYVGMNFNAHPTAAALLGNLAVNYKATTGAQTATFTATNKPGSATTAPAKWVPITLDGVQYYLPAWT